MVLDDDDDDDEVRTLDIKCGINTSSCCFFLFLSVMVVGVMVDVDDNREEDNREDDRMEVVVAVEWLPQAHPHHQERGERAEAVPQQPRGPWAG